MKKNCKIIPCIFCCFTLSFTNATAQEKKYYLAAAGNDNNDGFSQQTAWRSLDKINATQFKPGDSILLEGGNVFNGNIKLTADDNGSVARPVVFASFGKGNATIDAGDHDGLLAISTSFLKIISLNFEGSGVKDNKGSGIHFFANDSLNTPSDIEISNCDIKGFNTYGIAFGANDNISIKGYRHVLITNCTASENGQAGIASYGSQFGFQHKDFYLAYCKAFGNRGILSKTQNHSGNGIVMGMVDSLIIEHCEAYENGADNRCDAGGPVGIWVWMCKNAIVQYCTSYDNYAGATKDGGGFDIDGGASNCIIQYNYSYNNEGAGYLLAEYGALFPFANNIIRFNISANDGRKNSYGAISLWGADSAYSVTNSYVYNNTIYLDDKNIVNGTPAAIAFMGPHFKNVIIANNIFVTKGNTNFINSDNFISKDAAFMLHNNYYSYSNRYLFKSGTTTFSSLQQWFKKNHEQERSDNISMYLNIDPLFSNDIFLSDKISIIFSDDSKKIFTVQKRSLLQMEKFSLPDYFPLTPGVTDISGNILPANGTVFPGASVISIGNSN